MTTPVLPAPGSRAVQFRGRSLVITLPTLHDSRLKLSAVIMTLQVLGQTVLDFKVSIAQILVCLGVCAAIEMTVTWRRVRLLVWPSSALLTGNSVAFILRASGTAHGDWWSLRGIWIFVMACVLSMLAKHLIRPLGRHLFNPSNVGIVWTLLVVGPGHAFPQYLWWGPPGPAVALAYVVILAGAVWVLPSVRMSAMAVSFLGTLAVLVGALALSGKSFLAIWHEGPLEGTAYWANIALSPEVFIFVFFMMSDPQTAPRTSRGRVLYGTGTAALASVLLVFQTTEFGVKLAMLSSLTVMCALVPLLDVPRTPMHAPWAEPGRRARRFAAVAARPAVLAAAIIAVAAPLNTTRLADDPQLILLERGLAGPGNSQ